MSEILQVIYNAVWGAPALILILGVGIWLSWRTGFAQLRLLPRAVRRFFSRLFNGADSSGGVSSFQALCTALAATVGTGNLAGVAGAISIGGPGAIFWMWVCGIFGMVIKFAEATLAVRYRVKNSSGEYVGGPMYIIRRGLPGAFRPLAAMYSVFGLVAAFGVGNATQINTVIVGLHDTLSLFHFQTGRYFNLLVGGILAVLIGAMLLGGARRIGQAAELLVPFAAGLYLVLGTVVLFLRLDAVPAAFAAILEGAFQPQAVTGGVIGSALTGLRTGVSRGVFTNEAGMGTASIAHASAQVRHPVEQGLMGIVEVFLDTIVICTMTALVILCSGVAIPYGTDAGVSLTTGAFASVLGDWVCVVIALSLCLFAFATVLGWGLYGIRCAQYLFGEGVWKKFVYLQIATVIVGAVLKAQTVWLLAETVNGLMAIPNLIALGALTPELLRLYRDYTGSSAADGGSYENIHQCQPVRILSHEKISSLRGSGQRAGKADLPSEHRPARSADAGGVLRGHPGVPPADTGLRGISRYAGTD